MLLPHPSGCPRGDRGCRDHGTDVALGFALEEGKQRPVLGGLPPRGERPVTQRWLDLDQHIPPRGIGKPNIDFVICLKPPLHLTREKGTASDRVQGYVWISIDILFQLPMGGRLATRTSTVPSSPYDSAFVLTFSFFRY